MRQLRTFFIGGAILVGVGYFLYRIIYRILEKGMLKVKPNGEETPESAGLEYEALNIQSGNRYLKAWYVRAEASNDTKKAFLIYHGVDESLSDWVPALRYLWEHGISAMVFDYSGFGDSGGKATVTNLRQDAQAAYRAFLSRTRLDCQKYTLGYSLGTGVLLDVASTFPCPPDGLILVAGYTSARDAAVRAEALPPYLTFIIPDVYNNVRAVQQLKVPLLIIHSRGDELFPMWMPSQIYAAANEPKRLVVLEDLAHGMMVDGKPGEYLAPVVEERW